MEVLVYHTTNLEARESASDLADLAEDDLEARSALVEMFMSSDYKLKAVVQTEDLESAFRDTNSINNPWYDNDNVEMKDCISARSTMLGDLFATGRDKTFEVFVVGPYDFIKVI